MSEPKSRFNLVVIVLLVVALALSAYAVLRTSPAKVETLGTTNFSAIQADSVTATTVTATTLVSQSVAFAGTDATLTGDVTAGTLAVGGGYGSTGCTMSAAGVLQCNGAATIDGALTVGGFAFSGAVRGGTAASYTSGSAITHGFSSAPAWCIFQPIRDVTSTLTIGATTFSSDTATRATPIYWVCGK